jgi:hypothetical protein
MFVSLLLKKQGGPEVACMGLQNAGAENDAPAFTLLGDLKILYLVGGKKIADDHFGLCFTVGIRFIWETDVHPGIKKGGELVHIARPDGRNYGIHILEALV